jgi:hypothetical protein
MAASWAADVVDHLIGLRADGIPFEKAWTLTMRLHPPRGRDMGSPRLFEEDGRAVDGLVPFRRVAEDAYNDTQGPVGGEWPGAQALPGGHGPFGGRVRAGAAGSRPSQAGGVMAFHRHRWCRLATPDATSCRRWRVHVNFERRPDSSTRDGCRGA